MQLSEIWIYPIKSLGGISLTESIVQRRGLQYDRRWMLVDPAGKFVSQREIPEMALLATTINTPWLEVYSKQDSTHRIQIPLDLPEGLPKVMVEVWSARCAARLLPQEISDWFSNTLGQELRLVQMPDTTRRAADGRYAPKGQYVSFADGFPFLIIGEASLADLNQRLDQPLPMNRFRPNFVFSGGTAFDEDQWQEFRIGSQEFKAVKPCARCPIPTINQETAEMAKEPLKTLATFRRRNNRIYFGQNVVWLGDGENVRVHIGDLLLPKDGE